MFNNYVTIFIFLITIVLNINAQSASTPSNFGACQDARGKTGFCTYAEDCQSIIALLNKIKTGSFTQDHMTYINGSFCGHVNKLPLICCVEIDSQPTTPTGSVQNLPGIENCPVMSTEKIYGGVPTKIGEFPFMAVLLYTLNNVETSGSCGGSLITARYVLTAAHCCRHSKLKGKQVSGVRLGEWNKLINPDCEDGVCVDSYKDFGVESIIIHNGYVERTLINDIALIRLVSNVKFSDQIKIICLPIEDELATDNLVGTDVDVSGWGNTELRKPSDVKLKVRLPVVSLQDCNKIYTDYQRTITDTQMCAGGKRLMDSCGGDSGGPLLALDSRSKKQHYHYLAGIVSYGIGCGEDGVPGVYTRVGAYIDWISNNIKA